jgi:hypothetical protein
MDEQAGRPVCRPEPDHQRPGEPRRTWRDTVEEQTKTGQAQALDGDQTRGKTSEQGLRALRTDCDGLVFFKLGDRRFF